MKTPSNIYKHLDQYVWGQEHAKKQVANTLFMHLIHAVYAVQNPNEKTSSSNLLLMGPSGCGKTYMLETGCEYLGIPFYKVNAKSLTNTGYVGMPIDKYLESFYCQSTFADKRMFEFSVILIDEFDKICQDFSAEKSWFKHLQYSLLKAVEDMDLNLGRGLALSTKNMLFVFAGNFEELRDKRKDKASIGFGDTKNKESKKTMHEELIEFGVVRELVGRIGNIGEIELLTLNDLYEILVNSKASIYHQYQKVLQLLSMDLNLSERELKKIAKKAHKMKIGARGLSVAMNEYISEKIFYVRDIDIDLEQEIKANTDDEPTQLPANSVFTVRYMDDIKSILQDIEDKGDDKDDDT